MLDDHLSAITAGGPLTHLLAAVAIQGAVATLFLVRMRQDQRVRIQLAGELRAVRTELEALRAAIAELSPPAQPVVTPTATEDCPPGAAATTAGTVDEAPADGKRQEEDVASPAPASAAALLPAAEPITPERIVEEYQEVVAAAPTRDGILDRWQPQIVEVKNSQQRVQSPGDLPNLLLVESPETETYYWLIHLEGNSGYLVPSLSMHRARVRYLTPDRIVMGALFDDVFVRAEGPAFTLDAPARVTVNGGAVHVQVQGRISIPPRI